MRNILFFILAILLPVAAFVNFSYIDNGSSSTSKDTQEAAIQMAISGAGGSDVDEPEADDGIVYKIPKVFYTEPATFPSTSNDSNAYIDRIKNPSFYPIRNWDVAIRDIDASSAISIEPIAQKVLYHKDIFSVRPIASLSKLMTAIVVVEEMNLNDVVVVSHRAISVYGDAGGLVIEEEITVENLLYALLVASSNDAAVALEEYYNFFRIQEHKTFVAAMNEKAQKLGLEDTFFVEPSGLNVNNRSTVYDLARLADYVFQIPKLREVLSVKVIDVQSVDGLINHHLVNSNGLLGVLPNVLAGKTGYTDEAGESILLFVRKDSEADDYLIHIVLGSSDRLKVSRELIEWVEEAYVWN